MAWLALTCRRCEGGGVVDSPVLVNLDRVVEVRPVLHDEEHLSDLGCRAVLQTPNARIGIRETLDEVRRALAGGGDPGRLRALLKIAWAAGNMREQLDDLEEDETRGVSVDAERLAALRLVAAELGEEG